MCPEPHETPNGTLNNSVTIELQIQMTQYERHDTAAKDKPQ